MKNRRNIVEQQNPPQNPNDIWLKDGKFYRSTSEGWAIVDSKLEYTNKETMIADNPKGGTIGIDKESGAPSIYNDVTKQWSPLGGGVIETTWQELKDKRDAGKLTPGALYRITDYNCTTTQANTRSADHQFDIVLLALSENKLAEEAWAMPHDGDEYFQNSNLSAWKVWYCLDNDKSRFAWADDSVDEDSPASITSIGRKGEIYTLYRDTADDLNNLFAWKESDGTQVYTASQTPSVGDTIYDGNGVSTELTVSSFTPAHKGTGLPNGRGVIYRLIDEWNNDVPYDFKNIQFKRKITDGQYDANGTDTWCYTLNIWYQDMCQDASIVGNTLPNYWNYISGVYDNVFGYATAMDLFIEGANTFAFVLGNNVVLSFLQFSLYSGIYSNTIGNSFHSNTIGDNFNSNIIGNYFSNNTIGNGFGANIIRNGFGNNTIGNDFYGNTIGNDFLNKNISTRLAYANYGNDGVELATKNDIGNIETALSNI